MGLLNKRLLKERILQIAQSKGRSKFTRVSITEMEPKVEAAINKYLDSYIHSLPSVGKKIK